MEDPTPITPEEMTPAPEEKIVGPVAMEETIAHERYDDVFTRIVTGPITAFKQAGQQYQFHTQQQVQLYLEPQNDHLLRIRYLPAGFQEADFSYAIDPAFQKDRSFAPNLETQENGWALQFPDFTVEVGKTDGKLRFVHTSGQTLLADRQGYAAKRTILEGLNEVQSHFSMEPTMHYYGLGDKSGPLVLNGYRYENWNTDAYAFGAESDPLYKSIPFFIGVSEQGCFGFFLDNSYRSYFDFGKTEPEALTVTAAGGTYCYYFIYGANPTEVVQRYASLTGKPGLPALWTLGFHQCRWSYFPEARVREVCQEFRDRQIPCDAIYLDIDYMDGYRCFTWNHEYFPEPAKMIRELKEQGFQTVVMIDPGIKVDPGYHVYDQGIAADYFCRRTNGERFIGPVWPQDCVFPDYTRAEVRQWWGALYQELYMDQEVAGFWNDMNEPAVFKVRHMTFPDAVQHHYEGHTTDHRKTHNVYGLQMSRSTYEGLLALRPERRPFVITRATFSGGQRYAFAWTGDNVASWEHLHLANIQSQRMSISGFSMIGSDIGGFVDQPEGELFVRWVQLGVFHPLFRIHSMGNNEDGAGEIDEAAVQASESSDRLDQEPWAFGTEVEAAARKAIELRYQLLPYLYTQCWFNSTAGSPVLRPLAFFDPTDPKLRTEESAFMLGEQMLVLPVEAAGLEHLQAYLPKGQWYRMETEELLEGQQTHTFPVDLESFPILLQAGTILLKYPVVQSTAELPAKEVYLEYYYQDGDSHSVVYEDQGEGFGYQRGQYCLRHFQVESSAQRISIKQRLEGDLRNLHERIQFRYFGLPGVVQRAIMDGQALPLGATSINVPADFQELTLFL